MERSLSTEQRTDPDIEFAREEFKIKSDVYKAEALDQAVNLMAAIIREPNLIFDTPIEELGHIATITKHTLSIARDFEEYLSS